MDSSSFQKFHLITRSRGLYCSTFATQVDNLVLVAPVFLFESIIRFRVAWVACNCRSP